MSETVKLVATDVDGTLTDGGMYYMTSGESFKRFHVQDGLAVALLKAVGIEVAFISSDDSLVLSKRAERLGVSHCYAGVKDKVAVAQSICDQLDLEWDNWAYLGDDLQDYHLMQRVGLGAAVGDAHPLIKQIAQYQCQRSGGQGAFRELAEWLIGQQGYDIKTVWEQLTENE